MKKIVLFTAVLVWTCSVGYAQQWTKVTKKFQNDSITLFPGEIYEVNNTAGTVVSDVTTNFIKVNDKNVRYTYPISPVTPTNHNYRYQIIANCIKKGEKQFFFDFNSLKPKPDTIRVIMNARIVSFVSVLKDSLSTDANKGDYFRIAISDHPSFIIKKSEIPDYIPPPKPPSSNKVIEENKVKKNIATNEDDSKDQPNPNQKKYYWLLLIPGVLLLLAFLAWFQISCKMDIIPLRFLSKRYSNKALYSSGSLHGFLKAYGIKDASELGKLNDEFFNNKLSNLIRKYDTAISNEGKSENSNSTKDKNTIKELENELKEKRQALAIKEQRSSKEQEQPNDKEKSDENGGVTNQPDDESVSDDSNTDYDLKQKVQEIFDDIKGIRRDLNAQFANDSKGKVKELENKIDTKDEELSSLKEKLEKVTKELNQTQQNFKNNKDELDTLKSKTILTKNTDINDFAKKAKEYLWLVLSINQEVYSEAIEASGQPYSNSLNSLILKYIGASKNKILQLGRWEQIFIELSQARVISDPELMRKFINMDLNEEKLINILKLEFYSQLIQPLVGSLLILCEEFRHFEKFSNDSSNAVRIIESKFGNHQKKLLDQAERLSFTCNYCPLFDDFDDYAIIAQHVNGSIHAAYQELNDIPRNAILEIKSYGFKKNNGFEVEETKVIVK